MGSESLCQLDSSETIISISISNYLLAADLSIKSNSCVVNNTGINLVQVIPDLNKFHLVK